MNMIAIARPVATTTALVPVPGNTTETADAALLALWSEIKARHAEYDPDAVDDVRRDTAYKALSRKERQMAGMVPRTPAGVLALFELLSSFEGMDETGRHFVHKHSPQAYRGVLAGVRGLAAREGVLPVGLPALPDPVVVLWNDAERARRAMDKAYRELDRLEGELTHEQRVALGPVLIAVGNYSSLDRTEIPRAAKECGLDPAPFLAQYDNASQECRAARDAAGLGDLDREYARQKALWWRLMRRLPKTAATTLEGVIVKLHVLRESARAGDMGIEVAVAKSAMDDLRRLQNGGGAVTTCSTGGEVTAGTLRDCEALSRKVESEVGDDDFDTHPLAARCGELRDALRYGEASSLDGIEAKLKYMLAELEHSVLSEENNVRFVQSLLRSVRRVMAATAA